MTFCRPVPIHGRTRRGVLLLEVLVALALLIFGLAVVGLQINAGIDAARSSDMATRALLLVDTKMSELNAGALRPQMNEDEMKGDFGLAYPGFSWRLLIQPTDIEKFYMLTLEIGHNPAAAEQQIGSPTAEIDIEDSGTRILATVHRLMPLPADVNLDRDFGISADEVERMKGKAEAAAPGGVAGAGGGAAAAAAGAAAAKAGFETGGGTPSIDDLAVLLAQFAATGNFDPRILSDVAPEELSKYQDILEMMLGRKGGMAQSVNELMEQLTGRGRGRGRGRPGRGGDRGGDRNGGERREGRNDGGEADGGNTANADNDTHGARGRGRASEDQAPTDGAGDRPRGGRGRNQDENDSDENRTGGRNGRDESNDGRDTGGNRGGTRGRGRDSANNNNNADEGGSGTRRSGRDGARDGSRNEDGNQERDQGNRTGSGTGRSRR